MEFLLFFVIVAAAGIVLLWRARRNTTSWEEFAERLAQPRHEPDQARQRQDGVLERGSDR